MNISQVKTEGLTHIFECKVSAQDFQKRFEDQLLDKGKDINFPGFRPGKAPLSLLKQRYGDSARRDTLEKFLDEGIKTILRDAQINYIGRPEAQIDSFEESGDLSFTVTLEQYPELTPVDITSIKVECLKPVVDEETINQTLQRLAEEHNHAHPLTEDRPAKRGDILQTKTKITVLGSGQKAKEIKDFQIDLGVSEILPEFEQHLFGARVGDSRTFTVAMPTDFPSEELAGQQTEFEVRIEQISERCEEKIDDELAHHMGYENLKALRSAIQQSLEREYGEMAFTLAKRSVLDQLADKVSCSLPEKIVEQECKALEQELSRENSAAQQAGEKKNPDISPQDIRKLAERRVRLALLLADIGKKNNIELSQAEIQAAVFKELRKYPGQEKNVLSYYQKNPSALEHLKAPIYENKVIQAIIDKAQTTERSITLEELSKEFDKAEGEEESH